MENLPFFSLVFLRKRRCWAFLKTRFRPWIHQPSESLGLTLATETTLSINFFSKTARYRLFVAVVRSQQHLRSETFGLLNVYLNYKFGRGLPRSYLFFSFFKNDNRSYQASDSKTTHHFSFCTKILTSVTILISAYHSQLFQKGSSDFYTTITIDFYEHGFLLTSLGKPQEVRTVIYDLQHVVRFIS